MRCSWRGNSFLDHSFPLTSLPKCEEVHVRRTSKIMASKDFQNHASAVPFCTSTTLTGAMVSPAYAADIVVNCRSGTGETLAGVNNFRISRRPTRVTETTVMRMRTMIPPSWVCAYAF